MENAGDEEPAYGLIETNKPIEIPKYPNEIGKPRDYAGIKIDVFSNEIKEKVDLGKILRYEIDLMNRICN